MTANFIVKLLERRNFSGFTTTNRPLLIDFDSCSNYKPLNFGVVVRITTAYSAPIYQEHGI